MTWSPFFFFNAHARTRPQFAPHGRAVVFFPAQGLFLVVCIFLLHRLQWLLRHMVGFPHKGDLRLLFAAAAHPLSPTHPFVPRSPKRLRATSATMRRWRRRR